MNQHLRTRQLHTYLNLAALRDIRNPLTPPPTAADETGRSSQVFLVDVVVRKEEGIRRATASGRDIYAFTAPFICEAVARILQGAVAAGGGARAPGAIFDAPDYLRSLSQHLQFSLDADGGLSQ